MLPKKLTIKNKARIARSYGSMLRSISKAGGWSGGFTPDTLADMTAMELVKILGLNNITFTFDNPEPTVEEKEYSL